MKTQPWCGSTRLRRFLPSSQTLHGFREPNSSSWLPPFERRVSALPIRRRATSWPSRSASCSKQDPGDSAHALAIDSGLNWYVAYSLPLEGAMLKLAVAALSVFATPFDAAARLHERPAIHAENPGGRCLAASAARS